MNPKYKSGRWPQRWLCWFAGEHQFKRSHALIGYEFCSVCSKARQLSPFDRKRVVSQLAADGARRMGHDVPGGAA